MARVKTSKLTGAALDWAVAKCEGVTLEHGLTDDERYSTDWAQGGPIIEREKMWVSWVESNYKHIDGCWSAHVRSRICYGPTPLIAAMRSFVASKLGDEAEVPDELLRAA